MVETIYKERSLVDDETFGNKKRERKSVSARHRPPGRQGYRWFCWPCHVPGIEAPLPSRQPTTVFPRAVGAATGGAPAQPSGSAAVLKMVPRRVVDRLGGASWERRGDGMLSPAGSPIDLCSTEVFFSPA